MRYRGNNWKNNYDLCYNHSGRGIKQLQNTKGPPDANIKYTISPTTTGGIPINELRTIKMKLLNKNFLSAK